MEWVGARREITGESPTNAFPGGLTSPGYKRMSYDTDHLPVIQSAPGSVASDEEDDDAFLEDEEIPWYHQQLYKLYGKEADYFLYPKTDDELDQENEVDRFSHLRNSQGAQELWQALRGQSFARLASQNKSVRPHLKAAYSAFVRESIQHRSDQSKDNFFLRSGVEDVTRLMDDAKIRAAQNKQRQINVMYRTSQINEDKFSILTYNNPLDHLAKPEVPESISAYMPSWTEQENMGGDRIRSDKQRERTVGRSQERNKCEDYSKQKPGEGGVERQEAKDGAGTAAGGDAMRGDDAGKDADGDDAPHSPPGQLQQPQDWSFITSPVRGRSAKRQHNQQPRYVFLTEEAAWEPGQFTKRRQEAEGTTDQPDYLGDNTDGKVEGTVPEEKSQNKSRNNSTASLRSGRPVGNRKIVQWQPLSMSALVQSKRGLQVPGQGEFSHGKTPFWTVAT